MATAPNKNKISTGYVITNPFTGLPMKETPDGISLSDKVFATQKDLEKFVDEHWSNPVFVIEVKE